MASKAIRLNRIERAVVEELWRRGGLESPDLDGIQVATRSSSPVGFMTSLERTNGTYVPARALRFHERVYSELHGLLDEVPVGFLIFFDGESLDAIEGYAHLGSFPSSAERIQITTEQAINRLLQSETGCRH